MISRSNGTAQRVSTSRSVGITGKTPVRLNPPRQLKTIILSTSIKHWAVCFGFGNYRDSLNYRFDKNTVDFITNNTKEEVADNENRTV